MIGRGRVGHVPKRGDGGGKPIDEQAKIFALPVLVRLAAADAYAELTGFGGRLDILPSEIGHFGSAHPRAKQQGAGRAVRSQGGWYRPCRASWLWLCGVRLCCAWPAAVLAVVADAGSAVILS